jgi:hypothetical protein
MNLPIADDTFPGVLKNNEPAPKPMRLAKRLYPPSTRRANAISNMTNDVNRVRGKDDHKSARRREVKERRTYAYATPPAIARTLPATRVLEVLLATYRAETMAMKHGSAPTINPRP